MAIISLIDKKQIRDLFLSGLASSGVSVQFSGNTSLLSGTLSAPTVTGTSGIFNSLQIDGPIISNYLSGVLGTTITGSGISYFPSIIDISGNNLHYYIQYSLNDLSTVVQRYSSQDSQVGWTYLDVGTSAWTAFPILGLTASQQSTSIIKHEYVPTGLNAHSNYFVSTKPIYAGNITGNFFDSAKFVPDPLGYETALLPSFAQIFETFDSRYVIKRLFPNATVVSGTFISGTPIFFETSDTSTFPTTNLATGRAFWDNRSSGFFIYRTGLGFTGFHLVNNIYSVTGLSGVAANPPTGNIQLYLIYGTGSGNPPSGNDVRFTSAYHQSGGPDPLNISGLSGIAATGQRVNVYNQANYVSSFTKLSFSGLSFVISGDSLNDRNLIISRAVSALVGNSPSPTLDNGTISVLGTGNILVSGVSGVASVGHTLYISDTGTQYVGVAGGGLLTGTVIISGSGGTTVSVGATTSSGRVIVVNSSTVAAGAGNVTGFGVNMLAPLFTGGFVITGSGGGVVTSLINLGNGVSGILISGSAAAAGGVGNVTGIGVNMLAPLFTGGFVISGSGGSVTTSLVNFGGGVSGIVISGAPTTTTYNISGTDVSLSFFADLPLSGSGLSESFIARTWTFTGYSIACSVTGSGLFPMSGNFYQRETGNTRTNITGWRLEPGLFYNSSGNVAITVTGQNRIGYDITNPVLSGLRNLTLGTFGF